LLHVLKWQLNQPETVASLQSNQKSMENIAGKKLFFKKWTTTLSLKQDMLRLLNDHLQL